mmetsp:Transcript_23351/g.64785  ORF Transcript_23351/g.64785 Transcript_23351/m.64785 type:complete len:110 (-) Transcript_23351:3635-3964(-)
MQQKKLWNSAVFIDKERCHLSQVYDSGAFWLALLRLLEAVRAQTIRSSGNDTGTQGHRAACWHPPKFGSKKRRLSSSSFRFWRSLSRLPATPWAATLPFPPMLSEVEPS